MIIKDSDISAVSMNIELPEIYQIEVASICNLKCIMCPGQFFERKDKKAFIELSLVEKMIHRGDLDSSYFVEFQMSGEPLLHPQLSKIIDIVKSTGVATGLSTNGHKIMEQIDAIKKLDYITISVDSFEDYNAIRKPKGAEGIDIRNFIDDIKYVLYLANQYHISVDLQFVELEGWERQLELAKEIFKSFKNANYRSVPNSYVTYFYPEKDYKPQQHLCINPWTSVSVQANGNVVPCCFAQGDDIIYGNLHDQSLREIWAGDEVKKLREEHLTRSYRDKCKLCYQRSPALLFHRDMFHNAIKKERLKNG